MDAVLSGILRVRILLRPSHLNRTVVERETTAAGVAHQKIRRLSTAYIFAPVVTETFGPLGDEASSLIEDVDRRLLSATIEPRTTDFSISG
jgi:hypothetical protein